MIEEHIGISRKTQQNIMKKAMARGYEPSVDIRVLDSYVEDGRRSGRPREVSKEAKAVKSHEDTGRTGVAGEKPAG
jgi:hypothetical protein